MRHLKYIAMLGVLGLLALNSCKKETENNSVLSYYPVLKGDNPYVAQVGSYVEPGIEANGVDVTGDCTISGLDASTPGIYNMNYEYLDPNGIKLKLTRKVYVYYPGTTMPSGVYTSSKADLDILVIALSEDLYYIESIEGGHAWSVQSNPVAFKEDYGSRLAMQGKVLLKSDNTFELNWWDPDGLSAYGSNYVSNVTISASFDPVAKKMDFKTVISRKPGLSDWIREFSVTLTEEWK